MRRCAMAALLLASGCSHNVYSPPARLTQLESPAPVEVGEVAVRGEIAGSAGIFGPEIVAGAGQVRYGVAPQLEVVGGATIAEIEGDTAADTHPFVYAGRAGVKWAPLSDYLALTAGLGGGWSAGGGFVSPDLGVVVGFENRYVVPFLSAEGLVSVPVDAQAVDTSSDDDGVGAHVDTPELTFGGRIAAGLRVPLTLGSGHRAALYVAWSHLHLWDVDGEEDGYGGPALAFEVGF